MNQIRCYSRVLSVSISSLFIVLASVVAGCDSRPSKAQLGNVVFELPKVPGDDKPIALPFLDTSTPPPSRHHP